MFEEIQDLIDDLYTYGYENLDYVETICGHHILISYGQVLCFTSKPIVVLSKLQKLYREVRVK